MCTAYIVLWNSPKWVTHLELSMLFHCEFGAYNNQLFFKYCVRSYSLLQYTTIRETIAHMCMDIVNES